MRIEGFAVIVALSGVIAQPVAAGSTDGPSAGRFGVDLSNTLHIDSSAYAKMPDAGEVHGGGGSRKKDHGPDFPDLPGLPPLTVFHELDRFLNAVLVVSSGHDALVETHQEGRRNTVLGWMNGTGNAVTVSQSGIGNLVQFSQSGNGNSVTVTQSAW